jgi:hypothetical protein
MLRQEVRYDVGCWEPAFVSCNVRVFTEVDKAVAGGDNDGGTICITGVVKRHRSGDHANKDGTRMLMPSTICAGFKSDDLRDDVDVGLGF